MSLTQQYVSLTFVVLLNAVTLFMVVSEYLRQPRPFLRATAWAQACALAWHLCTVWLMLVGPSLAALLASAVATWLFSLGFLAAVLAVRGAAPGRRFLTIAAGATVLLAVLAGAGIAPFHLLLWCAAGLVMLATPVLTLTAPMPGLRIPLAVIQGSIGGLFSIGIVLVVLGKPELGGTLYLVNALLIPSAVQVFFQHALRLASSEQRQSEARYRDLFESLRDAYYWLDAGQCIADASPSVGQFGHSVAALRGTPLPALFSDPGLVARELDRAAATGRADFQAELCCADGSRRDCEVSIHAVADSSGSHFTGMIRDVTEHHLLEQQFLDAQRRESLGVLAGGVAHDFNNLLQGITSHAEFLKDGSQPDPARGASVQAILDGAATASTLCSRLLQYTGKARQTTQPVRLADTLEELAGMLLSGTDKLSVALQVDDPTLVVDGDETLLRQVVLNLLQNAIDASQPGGAVTLALAAMPGRAAQLEGAFTFGGPVGGPRVVCVDVIDTGAGMSASAVQKIFDPFYTTKDDGHGLGLSAVQGIIRRHGGMIAVRSAPGAGAHFRITLPASDAAVATPAVTAPAARAHHGQQVLVVDDTAAVRDIAATVLGLHGYRVLTAVDGEDALRTFTAAGERIDAVLSDINMPGLDGFGLLRAIREHSTVPVVLMSGLYNTLDEEEDIDANVSFLPKPFRQQQLLEGLAIALQPRGAAPGIPQRAAS